MNYTLNQLNIFLKITELRSITKAAEALYLTQPAVSIQLKNFQDQFEIPLTEVIGRQLYVTAFGHEIAEAAKRITAEVELMKQKSIAFKGQLTGRLTIAVVSTGKYVMPFFLSQFLKNHIGVDLVMDVTNRYQVLQSLERNEVDFALVSVLPDNLKVEKISIMENKLHLVANPELAKTISTKKQIPFEAISWIYREEGSATRQSMERFMANNNIEVNKKIQLTSNEAIKQAVLAGLGFSIMPLIGLKNELNSKEIIVVPVKGLPIKTAWNLIWLKGKKFSPAALAYLEYLKENIETVIKSHYNWLEKY